MAERLGNVVYWAGCLCGAAWIALAYFGVSTMPKPEWSMFFMVGVIPAGILWMIGRAIRYVLAAR